MKTFLTSIGTVIACSLFVLCALKLDSVAQATPTPTPTPTPAAISSPIPSCTPTNTPTADCGPDVNTCSGCDANPSCSPSPWPTPTPSISPYYQDPAITPIPAAYQPGGTGTTLQWRVYAPNNGPGPWPAVLVVHGGGFQSRSPFRVDVNSVAELLSHNGYYALVPCYRLAPCGRIPGQDAHDSSPAGMASGRPPQQTDDIMDLVLAARADSHCNGKVGLIGSSSGGALTTYVSLYTGTISVTGRPAWNQNGHDDRPDCAVSFSGVYDLSDQIPGDLASDPPFIPAVQNYTNTCDVSTELADSAISLVPGAASSFKPLFMVNSAGDQVVPPRQLFDMECALINAGIPSSFYIALQISGSDHAIGIWDDSDPNTGQTVGHDVVDFLDFWLK